MYIIWAYSPDQGLPLGLARQSPLHLLPSTTEREWRTRGGEGGRGMRMAIEGRGKDEGVMACGVGVGGEWCLW